MFRTIIYPSSGACDFAVELPIWSCCSWIDECWSFSVVGLEASACNTDTTPTQPHWNSNTHRSKNNTTKLAIQRQSRKLLMMDILLSETCWAQTNWNKIASDIKLVFYSSTTTMMHGPINMSLIFPVLSVLCVPFQLLFLLSETNYKSISFRGSFYPQPCTFWKSISFTFVICRLLCSFML